MVRASSAASASEISTNYTVGDAALIERFGPLVSGQHEEGVLKLLPELVTVGYTLAVRAQFRVGHSSGSPKGPAKLANWASVPAAITMKPEPVGNTP